MTDTSTPAPAEILDPEIVGAEIIKVEKSTGIPESEAMSLRGEFRPFYDQIATLCETAATITDPTVPAQCKLAKSTRLALKGVRCDIEGLRKRLKEDSLRRGKAIDGYANVMKYAIEPVEERMEAIEKHAEREETKRIAAMVADRVAQLVDNDCDPAQYNLAVMDDTTFLLVLEGAVKLKNERIANESKEVAERIARAQADRIAREKAEAEAAELRRQAEEREAEIRRERKEAALEAARIKAEADAKARAEREKAEAEAREQAAIAARKQAEITARLNAELEKRERAEREAEEARQRERDRIAAEKAAVEAKAKAEESAREALARAPDREKLMAFAVAVRELIVPEMATDAGKAAAKPIPAQVEKFAAWIEAIASKL